MRVNSPGPEAGVGIGPGIPDGVEPGVRKNFVALFSLDSKPGCTEPELAVSGPAKVSGESLLPLAEGWMGGKETDGGVSEGPWGGVKLGAATEGGVEDGSGSGGMAFGAGLDISAAGGGIMGGGANELGVGNIWANSPGSGLLVGGAGSADGGCATGFGAGGENGAGGGGRGGCRGCCGGAKAGMCIAGRPAGMSPGRWGRKAPVICSESGVLTCERLASQSRRLSPGGSGRVTM